MVIGRKSRVQPALFCHSKASTKLGHPSTAVCFPLSSLTVPSCTQWSWQHGAA